MGIRYLKQRYIKCFLDYFCALASFWIIADYFLHKNTLREYISGIFRRVCLSSFWLLCLIGINGQFLTLEIKKNHGERCKIQLLKISLLYKYFQMCLWFSYQNSPPGKGKGWKDGLNTAPKYPW